MDWPDVRTPSGCRPTDLQKASAVNIHLIIDRRRAPAPLPARRRLR
jgi:hypothetical protein